jgi:SAM-dependent methyltransferase
MFEGADADLAYWISLAKQYGDPVLELACGTGRVSIPLAQAGYQVTGVDRAEGMLRVARKKAADAGVAVAWVRADMRDFDLGREFSLVFIPANAMCHLLTVADIEAFLSRVRAHLKPEGRFALEVFVPKVELLVPKPGERFPFAEYEDPDGRGKIVVTHSYVYEPDTHIKRVKTHTAIPGVAGEVEGELNMHMFYPKYLEVLLKYNGFEIEARYGDFDRAAFGPESEKQLVVCRVRG